LEKEEKEEDPQPKYSVEGEEGTGVGSWISKVAA